MAWSPGKEPRISGRISAELRIRLDAVHKRYGSGDSKVLSEVLGAWVDLVEREQKVEWPVRTEIDKTAQQKLAEDFSQKKSSEVLSLRPATN